MLKASGNIWEDHGKETEYVAFIKNDLRQDTTGQVQDIQVNDFYENGITLSLTNSLTTEAITETLFN